MISIDELHQRAVDMAGGLSDFGDSGYLDGLQVLVAAVDSSPHRGEALEQRTMAMATNVLASRLHSQHGWTTRPEVLNHALAPQVIIVGLPRSGTTALHQMLAADTRFQWIPNWLAWRPAPRPPRERWSERPEYRAAIERYAAVGPNALHDIGPGDPEECLMVMVQSFVTMMFVSSLPVPEYHAWFGDQDERPSYRRFADNLRLFGADLPTQPWLLKNPSHVFAMAALLDAFPDARIVHIYRDPAASIVSGCSLITSMGSGAGSFAPHELGAHRLSVWARAAERMEIARRGHDSRFVDVDYRDFVAEPLAVGSRLYESLGLDLCHDTEDAMARWQAERPKDRLGAHRYRAEDFGLNASMIRERMHGYVARYGIEAR